MCHTYPVTGFGFQDCRALFERHAYYSAHCFPTFDIEKGPMFLPGGFFGCFRSANVTYTYAFHLCTDSCHTNKVI